MHRALSVIPDPQRSCILVQFYFAKIEWKTRTLHRPSYLEEFKRLIDLPPDEAAQNVRPEWLCSHLMVLCLAFFHLESPEREALGFTFEQTQQLTHAHFLASRELLFSSDFLAHHSLEHLQAIVLQGGYQYNVDSAADSHWALMGSAVKVAHNLGLARLGGEHDGRVRSWPAAWKDPLRREIGRRVWWNIVYLDWSHAMSHGTTYCVHPSQNYTLFPSNINDAGLVSGFPLLSSPMEVHTDSSFLICPLRFLTLYRELIDHLNTNVPALYPYVLEMEGRLLKLLGNMPSFFRDVPSAKRAAEAFSNPIIVSECIVILMTGETVSFASIDHISLWDIETLGIAARQTAALARPGPYSTSSTSRVVTHRFSLTIGSCCLWICCYCCYVYRSVQLDRLGSPARRPSRSPQNCATFQESRATQRRCSKRNHLTRRPARR